MNDLAHELRNEPDDPLAMLRENLSEQNRDLLDRAAELVASTERMPEAVEDEATAGKVADLIKLLNACSKAGEDRRKTAKEPHLAAGRAVDAFFKTRIAEPLEKAIARAKKPLVDYERRKAAEERRRREAEEAAARERERLAREAAEKAAAAAEDDAGLDAALQAEERARTEAAAAREAQQAADVSNAELSRTRGEYGAVASLRTVWRGEIADRDKLDLETLRPHIATDALQKAVNAYVRAGGRTLRGASIFEDTQLGVV